MFSISGIEQLDRVPELTDLTDDEFCLSFDFSPDFIDAVCCHGYYPMAVQTEESPVLLIKLHRERCVLDLGQVSPPAAVRRRGRGLAVSVDRDFAGCLAGIDRQHPDNWLIPPLATAFTRMHREGKWRTRLHSMELWEGDTLLAGEVGFAVGGCYSSLSGFHARSGAGKVQLYAAARLLAAGGYAFWDLGMEMEYKRALGAQLLPRDIFLERFRAAARLPARLVCPLREVGPLLVPQD